MWITSQIIGFAGLAMALLAYQAHKKVQTLVLFGVAFAFVAVSLAFLSDWPVVALNVVASVRSFTFAFVEHKGIQGKRLSLALMLTFMAVAIISVSLLWQWWLDWVLLGASVFIVFGNWAKGPHLIRVSSAIYDGLVIINYVVIFNIIGIVQSVLLLGSVAIFYIRFFARREMKAS